jgi:Phage T7 tail fibre protein.
MAYSTQRAVSNGTLQTLNLSINFFDKSEISVYLNNVPTSAYTWATANSIHMNSVVPNGVELLVRRTTDISEVRHVFSLGAQFKDSTLDDDFRQILHIAQEAVEGANVGDIYSTLNMHGNKITNVGLAVDDGDAISLGQVRTESQGAFLANQQAQAAAVSAALSAATSTSGAGTATTQAGIATAAAGTATTQAGISTTQAGLANTARSGAEAAQAAALASSNLAAKWAAELENVVVAGGLYSAFHYSSKAAASATAAQTSAVAAAASAAGVNLPTAAGQALKVLRQNTGETGLEYVPGIDTVRAGLLGTVSQSGGVPTGAVFESGSNANGTWTKYANGDMKVERTLTTTVNVTLAIGSMFYATVSTIAFSQTFVAAPKMSLNVFGVGAAMWPSGMSTLVGGTGGFTVMSPTSFASASLTFNIIAWGRWF